MRHFAVFILLWLYFGSLRGQQAFPQSNYQGIFNSYLLQSGEFYGVFDSTDSYFAVHFDTITQSRFDSTSFLGFGKIWHRGQITSFKAYLTMDTIRQMLYNGVRINETDSTDTMDLNHWAFSKDFMKVAGTQLWHCEGEVQMAENTESEFSGIFTGTFSIHFLYRPKTAYIKPLPAVDGFGLEPGWYFMGFWRGIHHPEFGNVPFAFANTTFQTAEENSTLLPDLRFQKDGSSCFSNIAIYREGCMKPPVNWYQ